jgi:hypothetical protein
MALAATAFFAMGLQIGRRWPRRRTIPLLASVIVFMLVFARVLLDSVVMLRLLPFSNAIVVANWQLPAAGLVIGVAWHLLPRPVWRRCLLIVPLAALGIWRFYGPLMGSPPAGIENRWSEGVCIQSSHSTCGAAAAATLLRVAGIDASESEMADLCLTRTHGTTFHGLYRGLSLKTAGTHWRVEIVRSSLDALRTSDRPILLNVGLPRDTAGIDPRYERDWGWTPGTSHSVVLFRFLPDDKMEVGDPAVGREQWFTESLHALWHGQALRLVSL